jgi:hypothetical protein
MRIVWQWKSNIIDWQNRPDVLAVGTTVPFESPPDPSLVGRDGWVAFEEEVKPNEKSI